MDAMLDQVELTCEVSFTIDGIIDKVEGEAIATTASLVFFLFFLTTSHKKRHTRGGVLKPAPSPSPKGNRIKH